MSKVKATFYTITSTVNDYQEEVLAAVESFSTGIEVRTVTFKDKVSNGQAISNMNFLIYARKSPKTLAVAVGDQVELHQHGGRFEVAGIDPVIGDRSQVIFYLDEVKS